MTADLRSDRHWMPPSRTLERPMTERQRILLSSIAIMVVVSLSAAGIAIYALYSAAFEVHKARLEEVVLSRARLIEAVGRFDAEFSQGGFPGGAREATLSQVVEAHESFQGFGETGEFTLARREGDEIVWLLRHRHGDLEVPSPISLDTDLAEPMRRALRGESGTVVGLDYRGAEVLAAYEFIAELGWGVVAKIDMREINEPFLRAGRLVAGIALLVIAVGAGLILRVTSPLIRRVEARTDELREARDRLRASTSEALLSEDRERRKLAVDLHDGLSQLLTLASMKLALLRKSLEGQGLDQEVREVEQLVSEARERSESVTFQLCPPVLHDVGLAEAAHWLADDLKRRYGLDVDARRRRTAMAAGRSHPHLALSEPEGAADQRGKARADIRGPCPPLGRRPVDADECRGSGRRLRSRVDPPGIRLVQHP